MIISEANIAVTGYGRVGAKTVELLCKVGCTVYSASTDAYRLRLSIDFSYCTINDSHVKN